MNANDNRNLVLEGDQNYLDKIKDLYETWVVGFTLLEDHHIIAPDFYLDDDWFKEPTVCFYCGGDHMIDKNHPKYLKDLLSFAFKCERKFPMSQLL